jgi:hypothetical protein
VVVLAAMAHGAGLMLVPIYLGSPDCRHRCRTRRRQALMTSTAVAVNRTVVPSGDDTLRRLMAFGVTLWFRVEVSVPRSWFNLDLVWSAEPNSCQCHRCL